MSRASEGLHPKSSKNIYSPSCSPASNPWRVSVENINQCPISQKILKESHNSFLPIFNSMPYSGGKKKIKFVINQERNNYKVRVAKYLKMRAFMFCLLCFCLTSLYPPARTLCNLSFGPIYSNCLLDIYSWISRTTQAAITFATEWLSLYCLSQILVPHPPRYSEITLDFPSLMFFLC